MRTARREWRAGLALAVLATGLASVASAREVEAVDPVPAVACHTWSFDKCSPVATVQIVTYNIREGFGGDDHIMPNHCAEAAGNSPVAAADVHPDPQCSLDAKNAAARVGLLASGKKTQLNNSYVPDVVHLQEVTGSTATKFAEYLEQQYENLAYNFEVVARPPMFTTTICDDDNAPTEPDLAGECLAKQEMEEDGQPVKAERDTAIILNTTTMAYVSHQWVRFEQTPNEARPDEDTGIIEVRWRYAPVALLTKLDGPDVNAANVPWNLVSAGVHWTGRNRFVSGAADGAHVRWANQILAAVNGTTSTPSPKLRTVAGDFNALRCTATATADAEWDKVNCPTSAWWNTFGASLYKDAGHLFRGHSESNDPDALQVTQRGSRIDYVFARRHVCHARTDYEYPWTLEITPPSGPDNASNTWASDHRALRALVSYTDATGCASPL